MFSLLILLDFQIAIPFPLLVGITLALSGVIVGMVGITIGLIRYKRFVLINGS